MPKLKSFFYAHRHVSVLVAVTILLTLIPVIDTIVVVGSSWQGIPPTFIDETLYYAHMHTVGTGHLNDGNPYYLEHVNSPPLVLFGGAWLNALPLWAGIPFVPALLLNAIVWGLAFALVFYWLFRELSVPPWLAVSGTILQYLQWYPYVWRSVNLQPVLPFYALFYIALIRLIREQSRKNVYTLAVALGALFYLYAYLWQTAVITLGLLFLYALVRKNWPLVKATVSASLVGVLIGLPVPLYTFWLSRSSPYFWESISRFGLVNTHLPMAEVVYSGGWVGVIIVFLAVLFWRTQALREDPKFIQLGLFLVLSGLGLWIMQGSNLITGKLLETGEHLRIFILPWLAFATTLLIAYVWEQRANLKRGLRIFSFVVLAVCIVISLRFAYAALSPFLHAEAYREFWQTEQLYARPFAWLTQQEKDPVVVWSSSRNPLTPMLPVFTAHFTLFAPPAMWQLVSDSELRERYLVSRYFDDPTITDLQTDAFSYLGRQYLHMPPTAARATKVCQVLHFWQKNPDCGVIQTPLEAIGMPFFVGLEQTFSTDIKPHIKTYLEKYHVSYILKDDILDPQFHPEQLGAVRVYDDGRFEIYHLP